HRHVPIGSYLAEVSELLSSGAEEFAKLLKTARPEVESHELAGFAHHRFASHLIQAQNDVDIAVRCFVGHTWRESLISHCGTPFEYGWAIAIVTDFRISRHRHALISCTKLPQTGFECASKVHLECLKNARIDAE